MAQLSGWLSYPYSDTGLPISLQFRLLARWFGFAFFRIAFSHTHALRYSRRLPRLSTALSVVSSTALKFFCYVRQLKALRVMALPVCNTFIRGSDSRLVFPVATQKRRNLCLRVRAASLRQVNQENHGHDKGPELPHTWLAFLTRLISWKFPGHRLRKDANVICINTDSRWSSGDP
ncbi:hypothetical protein KP509_10G057800 [Ceratopteris richardii]|uniref:Uncharacterized protein n=1 Tax=Ceratopteris richardii TaxID=49495 RepID=A0A8T2TXV3_CERRI|nr:hypothetical protein KP509_10G057800 [Ceratopteris richardii]